MSFDIKFTRQGFENAVNIVMLAQIKRIVGECLLISSSPGKALRMLVNIVKLAQIKRIVGECLLISSSPGKALRMLVDILRLADRVKMLSQSQA